MDMEWTKDLSIPFRYKEDVCNGTRRVVYLYTYIAVGKHIDGHCNLVMLTDDEFTRLCRD